MNFDFLKDLSGLGSAYENCTNAEKLVMTMPVQSIITSRKSAELLAKFIFLAAHNHQMETMDFVDILRDPCFRDFVLDRRVMNAFHSIRKSGNRAVHEDDTETVEEAIAVLENLHYVAGETACMLGLIERYPSFSGEIDTYTEAQFRDGQEIDAKAQKMFAEYVVKYDAQKERDIYYQSVINNMIEEFNSMNLGCRFIPGDVDLNEVIEFKHKPICDSTIKPIQAYFGFLGIRALKKLHGEPAGDMEDREINYRAELTIYGENGYTTTNLPEFVYGIMHDLPNADGFKITSTYFGPSVAPWFDANSKERKKEFSEEIAEFDKEEYFTYSYFEFLYSHGEGRIGKYEKGNWVDLDARCSQDIINKVYPKGWWCWNLDLDVDFDFEKHPDILEALHRAVKKHIPEDQIQYCENAWKDGNAEILCDSISWYPTKLRTVQDFLDEINEILKPIIHECDGSGQGKWFITEEPFAVATWAWTEDSFKVLGTEL